jgi:hypothetical protein
MMLNIITESVPHRAYVATDFGPDARDVEILRTVFAITVDPVGQSGGTRRLWTTRYLPAKVAHCLPAGHQRSEYRDASFRVGGAQTST